MDLDEAAKIRGLQQRIAALRAELQAISSELRELRHTAYEGVPQQHGDDG